MAINPTDDPFRASFLRAVPGGDRPTGLDLRIEQNARVYITDDSADGALIDVKWPYGRLSLSLSEADLNDLIAQGFAALDRIKSRKPELANEGATE